VAYIANISLGRILKIQGYDGTLTVKLEKDFIENIPGMESVFLEIEGKPVPFFISSSVYEGGDILKLKLDGYGSYEKVSGFAGCGIFLTSGCEKTGTSSGNENITGFRVVLRDKTIIGDVEEIIKNPGHDLMKIISPDRKEILIPFHRDFIVRFDEKKKIITVQLPEGLLDLN
jgi:16S rRNA processing protein RimM